MNEIQPDILFVNVGNTRKKVYQELSKDYSAIEPPFFAALTAGFIRKKGFNVEIIDANAENLTHEETSQKIKEKNPRLVNIVVYGQHPSASTQLMTGVGELCKIIKSVDPQRKILLTGLHPSALPEKTLTEEACDFVCEGEGFYTLQGLLMQKSFRDIPGLWWRENGEIKHTERAPLVVDFTSELSEVAWDLLPMDKYKAHNWHCLSDLQSRKSYASLSTSLGCPFNCVFCCINAPFGKSSYRMWSPEWVLKQIDILVQKYNVKNIKIIDELFVLNPEHFMKIADGIIARGYKINFWAYARVDTIKEEYLQKLKQAGFNWLALGIESASENVRNGAEKGKFNQTDIREIVKKIKDAGIYIMGNYIFGLPEDDIQTMQETLKLAQELNCEFANFYCASAYPGSKLYQTAAENSWQLPLVWQDFSQHGYNFLPLPTKHLTSTQVLEFRDNAFDDYFTGKEYLNMLETKFGSEARQHVEGMTAIKLKRKLLEQNQVQLNTQKMLTNLTEKDLIDFEEDIREIYEAGKIRAPVHFCRGNEIPLIEIFKNVKKEDWIFSTHRSHYHALLKGVSREWLKNEILNLRSIHINSREHNVFTSSIVGGALPIALGAALGIKLRKGSERVWVFVGDMCAEMGVFHECVKYAKGHNLPISFVVEDNDLGVDTPTKKVWGEEDFGNTHILRYKYIRVYPHHGSGKWVAF
jgi:radical SAM superfamily enzyme YgiQ (UPF0313 family)